MKTKFQEAVNYLVSEDKDLREQIEFVKTQGKFFEQTLSDLENQRQMCQFIIRRFNRSAQQLPALYKKSRTTSEGDTEQPIKWPRQTTVMPLEQIYSQDEMCDICNSIVDDLGNNDASYEYTIIDLREGRQYCNDLSYILSHAVINVEVASGKRESFDLHLGSRMDAKVFIRCNDDCTQAFLRTSDIAGRSYYFELLHFSILYLLDEDHKDLRGGHESVEEDKQKLEVDNNEVSESDSNEMVCTIGETGVFTLFDKQHNLFLISQY